MPYDFNDIKSSIAFIEAEGLNCTVLVPKPNQLFIDCDDLEGNNWFNMNIGKVDEQVGPLEIEWLPSPSGTLHHHHIVVTCSRDLTDIERIAMQAFLGSDRKREALSWVRLVNGDPQPTLFYQKKPELLEAAKPVGLLEQGDSL
jgi:hypothetical protein